MLALTGAGISVPSGIPDFRSPGTGLWANVDPMEVAHIDVFRRDPERFWQFYGDRFATLRGKRPNGAHRALAELERRGLLEAVVTQNIDGLHRLAGTRDLIEVHGSIGTSSCLRCGARYELDEVRARLGGRRRRRPALRLRRAAQARRRPVRRAAAGGGARARVRARGARPTCCSASARRSRSIPVAQLPEITLAAGGAVALVTKGPTPYDARRGREALRRRRRRARGVLAAL